MKSKNVLIVIPHLGVGGTEIQTLNTVRALVLGGYKVTVLCLFRHIASVVADYENCGAKIYCACPQYNDYGIAIAYPKHLKLFLFLYKHLKEVIRKEKIDVVHVQYMSPASSVILVLRFLLFQRNIIVTSHTMADIYKNLSLVHFIQKHCARVFTCITERAERSFFGASQLYSPETVLGKRNHFTIYNSLPARLGWSCNENEDENENSLLAEHITLTQNTQTSQNGKSLTPLLASGVSGESSQLKVCANRMQNQASLNYAEVQPKLNNVVVTAHRSQPIDSTQEYSHTDCTDYTDSLSCQHDLDTITQKTHCFARVDHPDGDCSAVTKTNTKTNTASGVSALNLTQKSQNSQNNENGQQPTTESSQSQSSSSLSSSSKKAPSTLGVVSRLEPIKGMDLVVPALAEVLKAYPETQLLVVGDGSLRASMEQQTVELGCADRIRWVGRQPQEELPQWYSQMDIVLMPSRSEGFGLTAIEAMAHGCVMVASDVGGLPEVVRDGICGLLHRTEDVTDMAAKITSLIGDPALYDQLRAQSLVEVEKYSFERYAELMNDLYNKLGK